jgi:molecular chaperone DnaJ
MHDFSHINPDDIFSMFGLDDLFGGIFGGGRGRRSSQRSGASRGYDLETSVELSLSDIATGAEKTIEFTRQDLCSECKGNGCAKGKKPDLCPTCGGSGQVARGGGFFQMVSTCQQCRGSGRVIKDPCKKCLGTGRTPKKRSVSVKIPAGVHEGQGIRITGEGEPGRGGGPKGDLYCYVKIKAHEFLDRDGNNLVAVVPISFTQAALGATIDVPTLNGMEGLKVPAGTQYGSVFRIKGKGLPSLSTGRTGDQLVQIVVETPSRLNEQQEDLLREFAKTENKHVSPKAKTFFEKLKKQFGNI